MSSKSEVKISIGYDDLVKLIGGTDEATIELRKGIAQSFSDHYIKTLVDHTFTDSVARLVKADLEERYGSVSWRETKIKPELQKLITSALKKIVQDDNFITKIINDYKSDIIARVNAEVDNMNQLISDKLAEMNNRADQLINTNIDAVVEAEIETRVKKRLQTIAQAINE